MKKLLVINSSPDLTDSLSRKMVAEFVSKYEAKNEGAHIMHRDIGAIPLHLVDENRINVFNKGKKDELTADEVMIKHLSNELVDEIIAADMIIIGSSVYNFTVNAQLKTWIDHIIMAGRTFQFGESGPTALLEDKPVLVLTASGFGYAGFPHFSDMNTKFHKEYLTFILGYIGLKSVSFIDAVGRNAESVTHAMERIKEEVDSAALSA
jgi:FMN-dependent NADH-azoreductase